MTLLSFVIPLGWANDAKKSSATSVDFWTQCSMPLPGFSSRRDVRLHRPPRTFRIKTAERCGHGLAQARLGTERPEHFCHAEQRGREPFGDGTRLARQCRELAGERVAH